ncbi:MAG: HD domain-containing protein [bacterium]
MIYTPLIQKAIRFAIQIHELDTKKRRKGTEIPYVTHPLTVGLILGRVTGNENIIAAGLLHDIIEDCEPYGKINKAFIEKEFNADVARMVDDVTESDKTLPWMERKMAALSHVKDMKHDSILVKSADVLHNLSELNEDIANHGVSVFSKFNGSKEDTILRYNRLIPELRKAWPKNPLLSELQNALSTLLDLTK